jgi:hypothetical protein
MTEEEKTVFDEERVAAEQPCLPRIDLQPAPGYRLSSARSSIGHGPKWKLLSPACSSCSNNESEPRKPRGMHTFRKVEAGGVALQRAVENT